MRTPLGPILGLYEMIFRTPISDMANFYRTKFDFVYLSSFWLKSNTISSHIYLEILQPQSNQFKINMVTEFCGFLHLLRAYLKNFGLNAHWKIQFSLNMLSVLSSFCTSGFPKTIWKCSASMVTSMVLGNPELQKLESTESMF